MRVPSTSMRARVLTIFISVGLVAGIAVVLVAGAGSPTAIAVRVIDAGVGQPVSASARPVPFVLDSGDSAATVGEKLQSAGLIRSAIGFRLAVRLNGLGSHLEAGSYELRPSMSLEEVISVLAQGRMAGGLLTIPEGWRGLEIADALDRNQITSRDDFLRAMARPDFPLPANLRGLPAGQSLEGFLFPDSYRFSPKTPGDQVARAMVEDFGRHLDVDLLDRYNASGLTLEQAVTLASIVE
ncbi:MAG: endolytic transglycosylase MltG, partial [Chloroflexota bacterium]